MSADNPSPRRRLDTPVLVLIVFGALWGLCRFAYGEVNDDAMITFVYARNLADGLGFVFNPGEIVYGTTTPLFGLFVSLGMTLGFKPWTWVYCWDVIWGFVILWRLRQMLVAADVARAFPFAAGLIVIASALTLPVGGMETAFYQVFVFGTLAALMRGESADRVFLWASLAAVTRPDGVVVLGVALLLALPRVLRRGDTRTIARATWPLLLIAVHAAAVYWWFGSLLPQSMLAKADSTRFLAFESTFLYRFFADLLVLFTRPHALGIAGMLGFLLSFRYRVFAPVNLFVLLYVAFFALGRAPDFQWYRTPLLVLMFVYAALAVVWMVDAVAVAWARRRGHEPTTRDPFRQHFAVTCVLVLLLVPQVTGYILLHGRAFRSLAIDTNQKRFRDAAGYIRLRSVGPPQVASHEIGHLGYFVEGFVYDFEGLVTPEAVIERARGVDPFLRTDAHWFVQAVNYDDPPFIARTLMERTRLQGFVVAAVFPWDHGMTYVFRRE
jgi:hypothetical protein